MASFAVPQVQSNPSSWGPSLNSTDSPKFANLPYAPFGRSDRIGRAADFTTSQQNYRYNNRYDRRFNRDGEGQTGNDDFQYKLDAEDATFQLVDTAKNATKKFVAPAAQRRRQQQSRLRQLNARQRGQPDKENKRHDQPQRTRRRNNWGGGRGFGRGRGGRGRGYYNSRVDRQASVAVKAEWTVVDEFELSKWAKIRTPDIPSEEDLLWCGFLDQYNNLYDKVNTKSNVSLRRTETKDFYFVSTTDDPVVEKLAIEGAGQVFATDAILAHLMASPRSVYPWDIVVKKLPNGVLFFDKRDSSQFDFLTVSETANIPPTPNEDADNINTPEKLSLEATTINQNFTQQILKQASSKSRQVFDLPNPFFDDEESGGMEPASVAYRYRKFDLGDGVNLIARTELHGIVKKAKSQQYMTAFALNEWDSRSATAGIEWRAKLDSQRGAVLATELKNNSCKIAKWTAQSILAGADQMKVGFVSRVSRTNNYEHAVLATQSYRPKEFAAQITLNVHNMWGIIKMLVELFKNQPQGKYVLMRDPNKPVVRLYSVPPGTFEEEDEDEIEGAE
eukprot:CAMPEP_0194353700 /NCGR_PEP_ID=MMETSP0174-20130528/1972_1 /TAXON_ID=216777 /ORGANISM="Proboscia alata, Strain PI-D3" /LENGTH=560 /DNA_ID=CAMNT_0039122359 /DNA_START=67 /DNA_END=1749 /DNA_ORIENTATION=+